MILKLILLIVGASQIYCNECHFPKEENGEEMTKRLFCKIDKIVLDNNQMKINLMEINKRLYDQDQSQSLTVNEKLNKKSMDLNQCTSNSDWTVIQRRQDGSINFNRNWKDYKIGFGNPNGDFFIGLQKLHALTAMGPPKQLWIVLKDFDNKTSYVIYDKFVIGSESEKYAIKELGQYSGDAGDSLSYHLNQGFSTINQENSLCADRFKGGWWYNTKGRLDDCYRSNLNGRYLHGRNSEGGVVWGELKGWDYSLKFVEMLIRSAS